MAEKIAVQIECPRCNGAQKTMLVDPGDATHTRECPRCGYAFSPMVSTPTGEVLREGMPTYPGEFSAPEAEAAAVETPTEETPTETPTPETESAEEEGRSGRRRR